LFENIFLSGVIIKAGKSPIAANTILYLFKNPKAKVIAA
jgi:hypothetical protein